EAPPLPTAEKPGFPNFIPGTAQQKSPRAPWPVKILGPIPDGSGEAGELEGEGVRLQVGPEAGAVEVGAVGLAEDAAHVVAVA
ncbi:unnamed protein product, partial [Sphagnum tenellum]